MQLFPYDFNGFTSLGADYPDQGIHIASCSF